MGCGDSALHDVESARFGVLPDDSPLILGGVLLVLCRHANIFHGARSNGTRTICRSGLSFDLSHIATCVRARISCDGSSATFRVDDCSCRPRDRQPETRPPCPMLDSPGTNSYMARKKSDSKRCSLRGRGRLNSLQNNDFRRSKVVLFTQQSVATDKPDASVKRPQIKSVGCSLPTPEGDGVQKLTGVCCRSVMRGLVALSSSFSCTEGFSHAISSGCPDTALDRRDLR